jgi:hypothetical protein
MAPLPASSRNSWNIQEGDLGSAASIRPLPAAPGSGSPVFYDDGNEEYAQYQYINEYEKSVDGHSIKSPIPYNPNQKWSYQPPSEEVVGLYPNEYEQGYEYERDGASIRTQSRTPRIHLGSISLRALRIIDRSRPRGRTSGLTSFKCVYW